MPKWWEFGASISAFYANVVFYCQFARLGKDGHFLARERKKVLVLKILFYIVIEFWSGRSKFWDFSQNFGRIKLSWIQSIPIT